MIQERNPRMCFIVHKLGSYSRIKTLQFLIAWGVNCSIFLNDPDNITCHSSTTYEWHLYDSPVRTAGPVTHFLSVHAREWSISCPTGT